MESVNPDTGPSFLEDNSSLAILYNLGPEEERDDRRRMLDELQNFMLSKGTPIVRVPTMGAQPLDLYQLYRNVVSRGGALRVITSKLWREIREALCLPASITSAAYTMRVQYMKYLYDFECHKHSFSRRYEVEEAIERNQREGRSQPSNVFGSNPGPSGIHPAFSMPPGIGGYGHPAFDPRVPGEFMSYGPWAMGGSFPFSGFFPDPGVELALRMRGTASTSSNVHYDLSLNRTYDIRGDSYAGRENRASSSAQRPVDVSTSSLHRHTGTSTRSFANTHVATGPSVGNADETKISSAVVSVSSGTVSSPAKPCTSTAGSFGASTSSAVPIKAEPAVSSTGTSSSQASGAADTFLKPHLSVRNTCVDASTASMAPSFSTSEAPSSSTNTPAKDSTAASILVADVSLPSTSETETDEAFNKPQKKRRRVEEDQPAIDSVKTTDSCPASEKNVITADRKQPTDEQNHPTTGKNPVPMTTDKNGPLSDKKQPTAATEEDRPATEEDPPATEEVLTATEEDLTATQKDRTATQEDRPATEEDLTATEEDLTATDNAQGRSHRPPPGAKREKFSVTLIGWETNDDDGSLFVRVRFNGNKYQGRLYPVTNYTSDGSDHTDESSEAAGNNEGHNDCLRPQTDNEDAVTEDGPTEEDKNGHSGEGRQ